MIKSPDIVADRTFNPFPGLRPFTTEESHLFFGREGQSQEVLQCLASNKFVAILGTSGSGKSSLMYCGVIPVLQGGFIAGASTDWDIITSRPGQRPIRNLACSISSFYQHKQNNYDEDVLNTILTASSLGLLEILQRIPNDKSKNILLLIDQFEELFRFRQIKKSEEAYNEVIAYIKLLLEVLHHKEVPVYVVITMRSDFIGECAQFQELTKRINDSHYLIPQMTRNDFRAAIEGPIAVGKGKITSFLVQQLLNDIGDNPDQLPILQHALMRTWDAWIKSGHTDEPIGIKDYENIGRFQKALSEHANEAYNELSPEQKDICQSLFKTLTEKGGDNIGVRRPTPVYEIAEIANTTSDKVIEVIEHFRQPGRSFLSPAPPIVIDSQTVIDISHESLMRIWDKLVVWVNEEFNAVQMYKRLADSALKYQLGTSGLWRPPDLLLALSWRDKQKPTLTWAKRHNPAFERTMAFLETSRKEYVLEEENKIRQQKRALRRTRMFAIVLGTASIISVVFMLQAFVNKKTAEKQTIIAIQKTKEAEKQREEALRQQRIAEAQRRKAMSSEEDALKQKELADKERERAEKSAKIARYQRNIATEKSSEALEQRTIAEQNLEEAKRQQSIAEYASKRARQLRMLSISQSMAVKSLQLDMDSALRGLVAYQAYLFNSEYDGQVFNPDIYNALYYAQKFFWGRSVTDYTVHKYQVRALAFKENSNYFYSTGSDGKIMKLNLTNNRDTTCLFETGAINRSLNIDGKRDVLYTGLGNGLLLKVHLSDTMVNPKEVYRFSSAINGGVLSKTGDTLVVYDNSGEIAIIDLKTEVVKRLDETIKLRKIKRVDKGYIAVGKSGELFLIDSFNPLSYKVYKLYDTDEGKSVLITENEEKKYNKININEIAISNDGNIMAIGDLSGNIRIFNKRTLSFVTRLSGHTARINSIDFDKNTKYLAAAGNDGYILVWNTADYNAAPYKLKDNRAWVMTIKFVDSGKSLMASYADGKIRKWDIDYNVMAQRVKEKITRNFTYSEWKQYVAQDVEYVKTIPELP